MTTAISNTLNLTRKLKASGFTAEQAEGLADALSEDVIVELATKADLHDLEHRLIIRLGAAVAVMLSLAVAAIKLL